MNDAIGLIVCHSTLAQSLFSVVTSIMGHTDQLVAFSNEDKSLDTLKDEIQTYIDEQHISKVVFFVDLKGGSCWSASRQILQKIDAVAISGINVPMLINFLSKKDNYSSLSELADFLSESSKNSIFWSEK